MGGSTSGFAHVAEAYWTTIVVTIVVSVVCLALAIATYVFRMDQRMRQDRHYGKGARGRHQAVLSVVIWLPAHGNYLWQNKLRCEQASDPAFVLELPVQCIRGREWKGTQCLDVLCTCLECLASVCAYCCGVSHLVTENLQVC